MSEARPPIMTAKNSFDEIFAVETDGWCYGIANYPGEIHPALVHRMVKELAPLLREAVENNLIFNVLALAEKLSRAAKYLVPEREIAFGILASLPHPADFGEEGHFVLGQLVDQVENAYGGALDRMQQKWTREAELIRTRRAA